MDKVTTGVPRTSPRNHAVVGRPRAWAGVPLLPAHWEHSKAVGNSKQDTCRTDGVLGQHKLANQPLPQGNHSRLGTVGNTQLVDDL